MFSLFTLLSLSIFRPRAQTFFRKIVSLCESRKYKRASSSSSSSTVEDPKDDINDEIDLEAGYERDDIQEMDWKSDEEFKNFMGNPSIETAINLEKKRADRKLKQLDRERSDNNPLIGFFNSLVRDKLSRERERLEKAEEAFKALDLNKLKSCFGFDTFFATDVRRFGDGGICIGNLRKSIDEVIPKLEKNYPKLQGGRLWYGLWRRKVMILQNRY